MLLKLTPILIDQAEMEPLLEHPFCQEVYQVYLDFYPKVGYHYPWIGYFALDRKTVVAVGGYKGKPVDGKVEIAYGTVPDFEGCGYATEVCRQLTSMALESEPNLQVIARTLMEENASTNILRKNGFVFRGIVLDPEDGEVWEWEFEKTNK